MKLNYTPTSQRGNTTVKDERKIYGGLSTAKRKVLRRLWLPNLLLLGIALATNSTSAQVSLYTFSQSTTTYSNAPSPQVVHSNSPFAWDSGTAAVTIPFAFTFNGVPSITTLHVNTNGFVTFGSAAAGGQTFPLSNNIGTGAIAAYGFDLVSNGTGTIVRGVQGTTPNRVFIIQWNNAQRYDINPVAGDVLNFQIRLYETSNKVEIKYGNCTATSTTPLFGQVGVRGATNADFNNRTSATSWAATTAGSANNATVTTSNTIMPASGLTLTWTPSAATVPACVAGFSPSDLATGIVRNPVISWTAGTGNPTSYDVYFGTSPTPPLIGNQAGLSYTPASPLAANTQYYWKVVAKNATGAATGCSTQSFTTGNNFNYCAPIYASGPAGTFNNIANVAIDALNNSSGGAVSSPFYTFYNSVPVPSIAQSTTAAVSVTFGSDSNNFCGVWIDFNQNGVFETSEGFLANNSTSNGTSILSIPVPAGAVLGQTRMRVRGGDDVTMTTAQACGATNDVDGETEDYIVNIVGPGSLPTISGFTPATVCANGTDLQRTITISGTGFTGTTDVAVNAAPVQSFIIGSSTQITAIVSAASTSGLITVTNPQGTATSGSALAVNGSYPFYADADGDTFGTGPVVTLCSINGATAPAGYSVNNTDCNDNNNTMHAAFSFYVDADGDGFGSGSASSQCAVNVSTPPAGYSVNNTDCNDNNNTMHATFSFYVDADGDGFGAGSASNQCAVNANTPPTGYSVNNTDCDDNDNAVFQSALLYADSDGDAYDAGSEVTCYGAIVPAGFSLTTNGSDCNDSDNTMHAGFPFYTDADGDGFGAGSTSIQCAVDANTPPTGYSTNNTDCDDNDNAVFQSALLYADSDGDSYDSGSAVTCYGATVPAGFSLTTNGSDCNDSDNTMHAGFPFYTDADGDGFGTGSTSIQCAVDANTPPTGYSTNNTDCDDNDDAVFQSALLYTDSDGDAYDAGSAVTCYGATVPAGFSLTTNGSDCNDSDNTMHAGFPFYTDVDGDGFGAGSTSIQCAVDANTPPTGYSTNNTDCDDNDNAVFQSALLYADSDGDSYDSGSAVTCYGATVPSGYSLTTNGTDCNDSDNTMHAGFPFYTDADGDGFGAGSTSIQCAVDANTPPTGYSTNNTDCDDNDNAVFQSALLYTDSDGDSYDSGSAVTCYGATVPAGYSLTTNGSDCNDSDNTMHAGFPFYTDADGDGFGAGSTSIQCAVDANTPPTGYSTNNTDCDDNDNAVFQSALLYTDSDSDAYDAGSEVTCYGATVPAGYSLTTNGSDCDDSDNAVYQTGLLYTDSDGDNYDSGSEIVCYAASAPIGYSLTTNGTDCDDENNAVFQSDILYIDSDGDNYNVGIETVCYGASTPAGYSLTTNGTDCDDEDNTAFQSALLYTDSDGDSYDAGSEVTCYGVTVPAGYSLTTNGTDCDDEDNTAFQSALLYTDSDGDTYDAGSEVTCYGVTVPAGYSLTTNGTDCDDEDNTVFQSALLYTDSDGDSYDAGSEVTCYGATVPTGYSLTTIGTDCDDEDNTVFQSALLYNDFDGDTYDAGSEVICYGASVPTGYSLATNGTDCDDDDNTVHAGFPFYVDADGDGFGVGSTSIQCAVDANTPPVGYATNNTDCDDSNDTVNVGYLFFTDADGDGFGAGLPSIQCAADANTPPAGYSVNNADCNDADNTVIEGYPFYTDADGDGYGAGVATNQCAEDANTPPTGYSLNNTDCDDTLAAMNPAAAEILYDGVDNNCNNILDEGFQIKTKLLPASCGATLASIGSLIGITTVSSNITMYRIRVTHGTTVQVIERDVPHFTLPNLPIFDYATTYSVEIMLQRNGIWLGYYGDACLVSSPAVLAEGGATQVSPAQCGMTLPRINTLIATTSLSGVTGYRFRITNITAGASGAYVEQIIDRQLHWFSLPMLTQYNYNSTYRVEVAVKTNGAYSGFGSPCEVSSPPAQLINCGGPIATPGALIAATSLQGATQYAFQIVRLSDNSTTTLFRTTNSFSFAMVPGYTPAAQYAVSVAVMTVGTWSPFGQPCQITSPGAAARFVTAVENTPAANFKVSAYPNPFESAFTIDVTASGAANVSVTVYDMTGRLIETREVQSSDLNTLQVGSAYPSGVYNVIVTQGENVKTLRVIKR